MSRPSHKIIIGLLILALGYLGVSGIAHLAFSQSQSGQQSPQGPATQPGETVIVPKKTKPAAPAPTPAPMEQKAEKINPSKLYHLSTATNLVDVDV